MIEHSQNISLVIYLSIFTTWMGGIALRFFSLTEKEGKMAIISQHCYGMIQLKVNMKQAHIQHL